MCTTTFVRTHPEFAVLFLPSRRLKQKSLGCFFFVSLLHLLCVSRKEPKALKASGKTRKRKETKQKRNSSAAILHYRRFTGFPTRSPPVLPILGVGALCYQIKRDKGKAEPGVLWATVIAAPSVNVHGTKAGGVRTALPQPRCTDCYLLYVSIASLLGAKLHGSSYPHPLRLIGVREKHN